MNGLYKSDERKTIRRSYENPVIQGLYQDFLGEPLSEKAEKYLHTTYKNRRDGK